MQSGAVSNHSRKQRLKEVKATHMPFIPRRARSIGIRPRIDRPRIRPRIPNPKLDIIIIPPRLFEEGIPLRRLRAHRVTHDDCILHIGKGGIIEYPIEEVIEDFVRCQFVVQEREAGIAAVVPLGAVEDDVGWVCGSRGFVVVVEPRWADD
jgi:hypothetical protein